MSDYKIVTVGPDNVQELGFFCVKNKTHPGYAAKLAWLEQRFREGMQIRLLVTSSGKQVGYLESIPGEYTWRIVNAPGYLVIHCIWVNSRTTAGTGMASALLKECIRDAESRQKEGAAVVCSDGTWMAGKEIFLKNGFRVVDTARPHFQLMAKQTGTGSLPEFPHDWDRRAEQFSGLQLLYTNQCPFIGKAVLELPAVAEEHGIRLKLVEFDSAVEARRKMPSPYGMFNLVFNGKLLADHPVSRTRFRNILRNDVQLTEQHINGLSEQS